MKFYELMDVMEKRNSLFEKHPLLASEWDDQKNGFLTAKMVTDHVGRKVWWKCNKGHSWQATVASRVDYNLGCPFCSGNRIIVGETDLATTFPDIAKEWHPTKNKELTPQDVKAGTNKKVWWLCPRGHEYEAAPSRRTSTRDHTGCPFCSGKRVLTGYNDLATRNPDVAVQWNYDKNGDFKPTDVVSKSEKKVWWICSYGHEWEARIANRTVNKQGCPVCAGRKVIKGFNDLATTNPEIAAQWHPEKNGDMQATEVSAGSNKAVWWLCPNGHTFDRVIAAHVQSKGSCPICGQKRVVTGQNDIFTLFPWIKDEWDFDKNKDIIPEKQGKGSRVRAWWKCQKGHSWESEIKYRVSQGEGCPHCKRELKRNMLE